LLGEGFRPSFSSEIEECQSNCRHGYYGNDCDGCDEGIAACLGYEYGELSGADSGVCAGVAGCLEDVSSIEEW